MEFKDAVKNQDPVAHELAQGRELAKQLLNQLMEEHSSPFDNREFLIDRILATYERALNLVNSNGHLRQSSGHGDEDRLRPSKKRRNRLPRRVEKVKLSPGEEFPSDGYSWRKYGQKIILGAKFRRGYFRCTHRHSQGCLAQKQVQKSDEDPTVFHVIYVDHHTCHLIPPLTNANPTCGHLNMTRHSQKLVVGQQTQTEPGSQPRPMAFEPAPGALGSEPLSSSPENVKYGWTTEPAGLQEGFSGPDTRDNSPFKSLEFTLEDLGLLDLDFTVDNLEEMFA